MIDELALDETPFGARGALLAGGTVVEFAFADAAPEAVIDRLFLGRVRAVDRELDAAFLDCGLAEPALLTARDARFLADDAPAKAPIGRLVAEGQAVVVQGTREPAGGKGARVTADVRLPGIFLLHRPRSDALEASRRLRGREREALLERGRRLLPEGGFILRAAAVAADDAAILAEAGRLRARWREIKARARTDGAGRPLPDATDAVQRLLRDHVTPGLRRISVGGASAALRCRAFLEREMPELLDRLERLDGDAFELTGVAEELDAALAAEVPLPGGGSLVIEPTAALTAIDVNGGGGGDARTVNLAAADEVARQLRLRNIGGTVVADFIDPPGAADRARVDERLRRALAGDPAPVRAYPMSPLGLVQISRRRRGPSLAERLTRPCALCGGSGHGPSLRRSAEALFAEAGATGIGPARVRTAPDLYAFLTGPASYARAAFEGRAGRSLELTAAPDLPPGGYVIG